MIILEEMFESTRTPAKWNIDGVCLWGYFFTDHNRAKLLGAVPTLESMGYRFVSVLQDAQNDDQNLLFLHVEREERHTVDTLYARNQELTSLAEEFGLESYDGMDVGPVDYHLY